MMNSHDMTQNLKRGCVRIICQVTNQYSMWWNSNPKRLCTEASKGTKSDAPYEAIVWDQAWISMKHVLRRICPLKQGDIYYSRMRSRRHVLQTWDIPGAYLRAPNNPNIRVVMKQPPRSSGTQVAPGKVRILRRAMPGDKSANQAWDTWRDYWLKTWGWTKVLAEPTMLHTMTSNGIARMEADNDDFIITAPTIEDLNRLAKHLRTLGKSQDRRLHQKNKLKNIPKSKKDHQILFNKWAWKSQDSQRVELKINNPKLSCEF